MTKISEKELRLLEDFRTPGDRAIKDRQAEWLRTPRVTVVDGAFGMPDMFKQYDTMKETMGSMTVTVRLFAEGWTPFENVESYDIRNGFLEIRCSDGTIRAFNTQDVAAYRVEVA